jgi:transposase-like protein
MQCPECSSDHIRKNGINRQGKQNYICVNCSRQFIDRYEPHQGYSDGLRNESLTMYVNGMGFRAIARVKKIHHTTVINWVKQVAQLLPNSYSPEVTPEVGELDELETFVGKKKQNLDMDSRRSL